MTAHSYSEIRQIECRTWRQKLPHLEFCKHISPFSVPSASLDTNKGCVWKYKNQKGFWLVSILNSRLVSVSCLWFSKTTYYTVFSQLSYTPGAHRALPIHL